jgi:hypothetical protein
MGNAKQRTSWLLLYLAMAAQRGAGGPAPHQRVDRLEGHSTRTPVPAVHARLRHIDWSRKPPEPER